MEKELILPVVGLLNRAGILNDKRIAKLKYFYKLHRWPDFEHPRDANEYINYLKFHTDISGWSEWADKLAVRRKVEEAGLGDTLVKLYGHWEDASAIEWDRLPDKFVLKCNHGSGDVRIIRDKSKADKEELTRYFGKMLRTEFGKLGGEPHYLGIHPCVIAEELLDTEGQPNGSTSLVDYKIWCASGEPRGLFCCHNRCKTHYHACFYEPDWTFRPDYMVQTPHMLTSTRPLPRPAQLDRMLDIARKLSAGFPLVRIDLYEVNGKVYFGEVTLTSQGGYMDYFTPECLRVLAEGLPG